MVRLATLSVVWVREEDSFLVFWISVTLGFFLVVMVSVVVFIGTLPVSPGFPLLFGDILSPCTRLTSVVLLRKKR